MNKWITGNRQNGKEEAPVLKVKRLTDAAKVPVYGTPGSAGLDFRVTNGLTLYPGDIRTVGTGLAIEIPKGYWGFFAVRSGIGKIGVMMSTGASVIDEDYRGEVKLSLINTGAYPFTFNDGDRIAQMVITPCAHCIIEEAEELSETDRGQSGFGSTGRG